ncbi:MAG: hypothetical protein JRG68_04050 [Deltaproteobacteria bacterium]|nr:hypothetical protein [Deltaproteobacteria bacterium]MBW2099926.1 hypothetical protein [Deltaproteobacteria bacterium]
MDKTDKPTEEDKGTTCQAGGGTTFFDECRTRLGMLIIQAKMSLDTEKYPMEGEKRKEGFERNIEWFEKNVLGYKVDIPVFFSKKK